MIRLQPLTIAILAALSTPALAQNADDAAVLDTVKVTAQRRVEDVQDVPISITTVAEEKLDVLGSGGEDIRFLSGRLPSLVIESSFGRTFPRFYVRGFGNTDFDINASQPVSLVYDDVVQENPILKGFPIFDTAQVELLRGPQGTLFGRNTPAGVVKVDSVRPSQDPSGYGQVSYGRYGTANVEGAIGGGFNDSTSGRVSVSYQRRDDWVTNTFAPGPEDELESYRDFAARGQLLIESDTFEALFTARARALDGSARVFRANIIREGSNDLIPGFRRDQVAHDGINEQEVDNLGGSARLSWDFGSTTLYAITGYETVESFSRGDIDGGFGAVFAPPSGPGLIPFTAESADGLPDHSQFTQEIRLESNDWGAFDWQVGAFWFDEELDIDSFSYDPLNGNRQNGYARQAQENQAYALFASGEYQVDALTLRGGLRYTNDDKDFVAERLQSPLAFLGVGPLQPVRVSTSDDDISWDLSAVYQASDTLNVFARVARGFRAPSIQGRVLFGDVVSVADSETALSFDAGIKADLFDRRARLGFTVFRTVIDDQQLTAVGGTQNFNTLVNADETTLQGVEIDFEAYLSDALLVTFGASYNDTEIDDRDLAIAPCGGGCTVLDRAGPVDGTVLIDGNPLPNAPKVITNVTARYGIPMGDGEFFVYTDWAYRSEINFFLYESAEFRGKSLLEGGLRIGYNWNYGAYEAALFGRNILDKEVVVGGIDFNNLTGFLNEPRIVGLEFKASF